MRVKRVLFVNRAPFKKLDLLFDKKDAISLTGFNGSGKTTILSYIVDAFYEIAKKAFEQEFVGERVGKLYRISSDINTVSGANSSLVYICFEVDNKIINYFDFQGDINEITFNELLLNVGADAASTLTFSSISNQVGQGRRHAKYVSANTSEAAKVFLENICTYFPSYRYEQPGYLNDVYKMELRFKNTSNYSGYLPNPIEVTSDLPEIANWIMDIVLDSTLYSKELEFSYQLKRLNTIVTSILESKTGRQSRLGIGNRHLGGARIQVTDQMGNMIYPTIFNMSAGESALFCLFVELIKQADRVGKTPENVEGIVLVDEIDKHLHISMQTVYVPALMQMFPKIQFIFSTHSTFINIGIEEKYGDKCKILDLNMGGIECKADENGVFREVYETMVQENNRYADAYNEVCALLNSNKTPYIITEGKTDWKHIKAAMKALKMDDIDVEIREYEENLGDTNLAKMLKNVGAVPNSRLIIGIFDRDNFDALAKEKSIDAEKLRTERYIKISKNVYAFAIPLVNENEYGTNEISIEHYYKKNELTKEDNNQRRIFLGEEFYAKGHSKDGRFCSRCKSMDKKVKINGVIDEDVFDIKNDPEEKHSIALSKNEFANLILYDNEFAKGFDFGSFQNIFDVITEICKVFVGSNGNNLET